MPYVIQPDGPVAVVDLRTLAVSYHGLKASQSMLARIAAWLTPSAEAKNVSGHWRSGTWLGDGLIAITGSDTASDVGTPSGLAIVDTRDWSVRMLDLGADSVFVADGLLLATGGINGGSTNSPPPGMGLAAYGTDWSLKFRLFDGSVVGVYYVLGNRAYVGNFESDAVSVVDLTSGHVIGRRQGPLPLLLLGDSSS
jgi:hypothetical protein